MAKFQPKFHGDIKESKFVPDDPKLLLEHTKSLEGEKVTVTMKKYRKYKQRTNPESRYYFGVVVKYLGDEWGYNVKIKAEKDKVHSIIKNEFLYNPVMIKNVILKEDISTADLCVADFESLMSTIREWASKEFSCYIPTPNEVPFDF